MTDSRKTWNDYRGKIARNFRFCRKNFARPDGILPPDQDALEDCLQKLSTPDEQWLVLRHVLAVLLLDGDRPRWLLEYLQDHLPEFPDNQHNLFAAGNWLAAPILTTAGKEGRLTWVVFGLTSRGTGKIIHLYYNDKPFDKKAEDTIGSVWNGLPVAAPSEHDLFVLPLLMTGGPISGGSLALPTALALYFLAHGQKWPAGLYATGIIDGNFKTGRVEGLNEKFRVARGHHPFIFLHPQANEIPAAEHAYPVADFDQARRYAQWHRENIGGDYPFYQSCLTDAERFLDNAGKLPLALLEAAWQRNELPVGVENFLDITILEKATRTFRKIAAIHRKAACFERLLPAERLEEIAARSADHVSQVCSWCLTAQAVANHRGDTRTADEWAAHGHNLCKNMAPEEMARKLNLLFVSLRHNRYDFQPEPPREFSSYLKSLISSKGFPSYAAGSMHGTLGQNFAFCGRSREALAAFTRAQEFFGARHRLARLRQYNYMAYVHLDCGAPAKAENILRKYLACANAGEITDIILKSEGRPDHRFPNLDTDDTPFVWALIVRFLAEAPAAPTNLWPVCRNLINGILAENPREHPWQLVLFNLGRLALAAGQRPAAEQCWRWSVKLCLNIAGDTTRPMALLPWSLMTASSMSFDKSKVAELLTEIKNGPEVFCPGHFAALVDKTVDEGFEMVRDYPERFFPFNYR